MIQKFSKCEVKTVGNGNFTILREILREIKFWGIETVKNVICCSFKGLNFDFGKFVQFFNAQND